MDDSARLILTCPRGRIQVELLASPNECQACLPTSLFIWRVPPSNMERLWSENRNSEPGIASNARSNVAFLIVAVDDSPNSTDSSSSLERQDFGSADHFTCALARSNSHHLPCCASITSRFPHSQYNSHCLMAASSCRHDN